MTDEAALSDAYDILHAAGFTPGRIVVVLADIARIARTGRDPVAVARKIVDLAQAAQDASLRAAIAAMQHAATPLTTFDFTTGTVTTTDPRMKPQT